MELSKNHLFAPQKVGYIFFYKRSFFPLRVAGCLRFHVKLSSSKPTSSSLDLSVRWASGILIDQTYCPPSQRPDRRPRSCSFVFFFLGGGGNQKKTKSPPPPPPNLQRKLFSFACLLAFKGKPKGTTVQPLSLFCSFLLLLFFRGGAFQGRTKRKSC